jgi:hypothetical protein
MSGVGSSTISGGPSVFLSLLAAGALGRKSATAAAITTTSPPSRTAACTADSSWAAVSTGTTCTPTGTGRSTVDTSVTRAPRAAASAAMA